MNISEIRRENLKSVIRDHYDGVSRRLALKLELNPSHISRLYTDNEEHRRNMGDKLARRIEEATGLKNGWLDIPHGSESGSHIPLLSPGQVYEWIQGSMDLDSTIRTLDFSHDTFTDKTFAIEALDSGMEPRICVGDTVIINPGATPSIGDMIVYDLYGDGHFTIGTYSAKGPYRYLKLFGGESIEIPANVDPVGTVAIVLFKGHGK